MIDLSFDFSAECWLLQAEKAAWHMVTLPKEKSEEISFFNDNMSVKRRGWGSVRVIATVGSTEWKTSIFPQAKKGTYVLPIKAEVRTKEKILAGNTVQVRLKIDL